MASLPRILVLEGNSEHVEAIRQELGNSLVEYEFRLTAKIKDYLDALENFHPALILADYFLLDFPDSEAFRISRKVLPATPVIIISGHIDEEIAVESMRAGAFDYVAIDNLKRLGAVLKRALKVNDPLAKPGTQNEVGFGRPTELSPVLFRAIIDQSPDAIEVIDPETSRFMDANETAWRNLGYTHEQFLSLSFSDIVLEGMVIQSILNDSTKADRVILEATHVRKDGTTFPVELHIRLVDLDRSYLLIIAHDITDQKSARESHDQQTRELARLYRASEPLLVTKTSNLAEQAEMIVSNINKEFAGSTCCLFLVEKNSNETKCLASAGSQADLFWQRVMPLSEPGIIQRTIRSGLAVNSGDISQISALGSVWMEARSELCVPLKVDHEVIGVIDLQSPEMDRFSADDERMMRIFSDRAAQALARSRLTTQMETRLRQLLSLRKIDIAITSSFDLKFSLNILVEQVIEQLNIDAADVLVISPHGQSLQLYAERGLKASNSLSLPFLIRDEVLRKILQERTTVQIHDLSSDLAMHPKGFSRAEGLIQQGLKSYLGFPLIAKGQVKGILEIFQRTSQALTADQRSFLDMLAGQAAIIVDNGQLFEEMQNHSTELALAYEETIAGWSQAMDLRDKETEGHSRRVTEGTIRLAARIGMQPEELVHVRRGALLHDIGKLGIPDEILRKPSALTEDEWAIMKQHPQFAYDMLYPINYLHPALEIPYCHHEKWDGSGYPRGLKEDEIPLPARIFAVLDVWDALTSDRPYRKAWTKFEAKAFIRDQAGKHFDPFVVRHFLEDLDIQAP